MESDVQRAQVRESHVLQRAEAGSDMMVTDEIRLKTGYKESDMMALDDFRPSSVRTPVTQERSSN